MRSSMVCRSQLQQDGQIECVMFLLLSMCSTLCPVMLVAASSSGTASTRSPQTVRQNTQLTAEQRLRAGGH